MFQYWKKKWMTGGELPLTTLIDALWASASGSSSGTRVLPTDSSRDTSQAVPNPGGPCGPALRK